MLKYRQLILIALLIYSLFNTAEAAATVINAASCSQADVTTAYNAAVNGDTVSIPAGDCDAANRWSSFLVITKEVTIQGDGIDSTIIGIANAGAGLNIKASNVNITGITLDCNNYNTSNDGIVKVGNHQVRPTWQYSDWRIHGNKFTNCGSATRWVTGYPAITIRGFAYGVIDNNTFLNCSGECIDVCADTIDGMSRSNTFGQYTNGTVFIENNTFDFTNTSIINENILDGNSAMRTTFRYNTVNICDGCRFGSGIISTHETCATCTGDSNTFGDVGTLVTEMYGNTINLNSTGMMDELARIRGGRALVYDNTITGSGTYYDGIIISNYRSFDYGNCYLSSHGRGNSEWCHGIDGGYTHEGLELAKTTLNGGINNSATTITLASTAGFDTNGSSVIIGTEQIDYTGVSGNTLTGCTRGANSTSAASHSDAVDVDYLIFGACLDQPNNTYVWGNTINTVNVYTAGAGTNYSAYDIKSYAQRPTNWQYRNDGTAYSYTPYTYPHPLTTGGGGGPDTLAPSPPILAP